MPDRRIGGDVVRFSFLVRHPDRSYAEFSEHYAATHGPLAASLAGFRRWTLDYVQHHCDETIAGEGFPVDGVTATTQRPRRDYSIGFLQEPDYEAVRQDEVWLFDVGRVRSVLSRRGPMIGEGGEHKALAVGTADGIVAFREAVRPDRWRESAIDAASASALGGGATAFPYDTVLEAWSRAPAMPIDGVPGLHAWRVRALVMLPRARAGAV